jgi:hypothetical protein
VFVKHKGLVFILFLTLCLVLSGIHYVNSLRTTSTVVSMEYEEASRGLTPSQTRFNIYEIIWIKFGINFYLLFLCIVKNWLTVFFDLLRQPPTLKAGGIKEREEKQKEKV